MKLVFELQKVTAMKDVGTQSLKARLDAGEIAQKLAVTEAVNQIKKERDTLTNNLTQVELEKSSPNSSRTCPTSNRASGFDRCPWSTTK